MRAGRAGEGAGRGPASSCSGRPGRRGASWWSPGSACCWPRAGFRTWPAPEGDGVRAAAAACLIAVLVAKVAGRLRTSERRRSAWRENLSDVELGLLLLTATYVFLAALGGVQLAGVPAGLRPGQLPGHLPPPGGRASRWRWRRSPWRRRWPSGRAPAPAAAAVFPGHVGVHRHLRGAERGLPARRGGPPAARAPPAAGDRGGQHARGGPRLPPDLHRPAQRQPGAHPRRGGGEAVAGVDRDHPPAAVRHPGSAAQVADAADLRPAVAGRRRREAEAEGGGQRRAGAGRGAVPRPHRRVRGHPEGAQAPAPGGAAPAAAALLRGAGRRGRLPGRAGGRGR